MSTDLLDSPELAEVDACYLIDLVIDNFKGIKAYRRRPFDEHPDNGWLGVRGQNESGKTSVLDAILWCLKPSELKDTTRAVRDGAEKCRVFMDLGCITIERIEKANGRDSLVVRDSNGTRMNKPQAVIDTIFSKFCLD